MLILKLHSFPSNDWASSRETLTLLHANDIQQLLRAFFKYNKYVVISGEQEAKIYYMYGAGIHPHTHDSFCSLFIRYWFGISIYTSQKFLLAACVLIDYLKNYKHHI